MATRTSPEEVDDLRRQLLAGTAAFTLLPSFWQPATAQAWNDIDRRIARIVGPTPIKPGRVELVAPTLAENGQLVSLAVAVDSPMTAADHVTELHVFSERNPVATLATFHLGPHNGVARVRTNVRLAASQTVVAIARMSDGSFWSGSTKVVVTIAACVDGG